MDMMQRYPRSAGALAQVYSDLKLGLSSSAICLKYTDEHMQPKIGRNCVSLTLGIAFGDA